MKFIQDKLGSIGRLNYAIEVHDTTNGTNWENDRSTETTKVRASAQTCRLDWHAWESINEEFVTLDTDEELPLKEVQGVAVTPMVQYLKEIYTSAGHPGYMVRVVPPVFAIMVKRSHDGKILPSLPLWGLYNESVANDVAEALVHAVELCGGGK